MLDVDSGTPLYEQIKELIRNNIQMGIYPVGGRIPSERTLKDIFKVNRLTVKRAITDLVQEGILYTQVGKGTYVSVSKVDQQLEQLTSFTEEMAKRGQQTTSRVLKANIIPASDEEAGILRVMTGTPLIYLVRLRLSNDMPMAIERMKIAQRWCETLLDDYDFAVESLYRVLHEEYHIVLHYAEQSIEARLATAEESQLLRLEPNAAILHMTRRTFTDSDQVVEYTTSAYCGSRYKFQAVLRHV
ncbi:MAG: GntR family transcriptional regulator [Anaerolineaceae bacterium]|nr:GntR family transcriptional regulator [Anaerolineaceae bacterium]